MEEGLLKLNLGCGTIRYPGYFGVDIVPGPTVDKVINLDDPNLKLPYGDKTVQEIRAYHVFEHITHLFPLINECWRVLKPLGHLDVIVPLGYVAAFGDPSHVRAFSETSFHYFTANPPGNYLNPAIKGTWKIDLNDWTAPYDEDTSNLIVHKQRELHVFMTPDKSLVGKDKDEA